jgi:hypothetical protein
MKKFSERARHVHQSEDVDTIDYISAGRAAQSISDDHAVQITHDLERLIDKVYRFYESGDYEEVILNAVKIEGLYKVCSRDEYRRCGRHLFNLDLKFRIDHDVKFLRSLYEDLTNVELSTSRITPEYARRAVNISNDMYDYITTYIKEAPPATKVNRTEGREPIEESHHIDYPISYMHDVGAERFEELNELDLSDYKVLFVGRQSFLSLLTKSTRLIAISCFLLITSIPIANFVTGVTYLPVTLRAAGVAILLYVAARVFLGTYSEQYIITTDEILIKRGVLFKKTVKAPIDLIIKQRMKQPFLGKILNFGNIFFGIYGGRSLIFKGVSDPKFICDLVRRIWHDRKRRPY